MSVSFHRQIFNISKVHPEKQKAFLPFYIQSHLISVYQRLADDELTFIL